MSIVRARGMQPQTRGSIGDDAVATAPFLTASTFDLIRPSSAPLFPADASKQTGAALDTIALLPETPVNNLRELTFPYPE